MNPELRSRTPRATRTAGAVLALALGLSGCGAGFRAQTYQERTTSDSTNEAIGALAIRHIRVLPPQRGQCVYPQGSAARVAVVIVNEGVEEDRLASVTSDAGTVEVNGSGGRTISPAQMVVPGVSTVSQYSFVIRDLRRELRPGNYVTMTLTFQRNGSEEMLVPVEVTNRPGPQREHYEVAHTDSAGNPIVKEGEKEEDLSGCEQQSEPEGGQSGERGGIGSEGQQGGGTATGESEGTEGTGAPDVTGQTEDQRGEGQQGEEQQNEGTTGQ